MGHKQYHYGCMMADINSGCNLRCPFCSNDWRILPNNVNMTVETYEKVLTLMPLAADQGFFFSCHFEPTIHSRFVDFVKMLPPIGKEKVFFTTNLAKRFPVETLFMLSEANIHHINISLDTLDQSLYEEFRAGARYDTTVANLIDLVSVFKRNPQAPKLRYIAMLFKQNMAEMPTLIQTCFDKFLADKCEVRSVFQYSIQHINQDWAKKSLVTRKEWDEVQERLEKLSLNIRFFNPPDEVQPSGKGTPEKPGGSLMRIESNGVISLIGTGERFDINELNSPYDFFEEKIYRMLIAMGRI